MDESSVRVSLGCTVASDEGGPAVEVRVLPGDGVNAGQSVPLLTQRARGGWGVASVPLAGGPERLHVLEVRTDSGQLVGTLRVRPTPPPARDGRIAFAFGSCWRPGSVRNDSATWSLIHSLAWSGHVDHLLLLGDLIYADIVTLQDARWSGLTAEAASLALGPNATLDARVAPYRQAWREALAPPAVTGALGALPWAATWDDHEITNGYGSLPWHREPRGLALLEAAGTAFDELAGLGNPPPLVTDDTPCRATSFRRGPAAFLMLDLRTHRDTGRGLLVGEAQRRAAEAFVRDQAGDASVLFVACSVPPLHLPVIAHQLRTDSDLQDQWSSSANESWRRWLISLVTEYEAHAGRRAVLLGGDVHLATVAKVEDRRGRRTWQLTSSPLANVLPWCALAGVVLAGGSFPVHTQTQRLQGDILHRFAGPNLGVVRGEVVNGRAQLAFELFRPGRRTFRMELE